MDSKAVNNTITYSGETKGNVEKIIQGHSGGELTEKGLIQAGLIAKRLADVKFSEIYVSDLNRTVQTSESILKYHSEGKVIYEKRIREKCGGVLEGKPLSYGRELAKSKQIPYRNFRPEGGECFEDVFNRAESFLREIISQHLQVEVRKNEEDFDKEHVNRILMITHGGFIMEFLNVVRSMKEEPLYFNNDSRNTALYVIKIYCSNCTSKSESDIEYMPTSISACVCKKENSKLVFDFLIYNDDSHLSEL